MHDIITIGSATRDAFFEGITFDYHHQDKDLPTGEVLCLPLGGKMQVKQVTFTTGGAGTNAAVTFARQELYTGAIVRVGNDISGQEIKRELAQEGVDVSLIQQDATLPTSYSVVLMAQGAERTILAFNGAGGNIDPALVPWTALQTRWLYLDSLAGSEEILKQALALKQQKGTKLVWNPGTKDLALGLDALKPYLGSLDIFLANKEELSELLGIPYDQETEIFKKLDELVQGVAIMTKGPKGVVVSDGKTMYQAGIFPEKALVDRTGAGDAFGSGFVVGYIQGGIEQGIRVASANSTSKLEQLGSKAGILRKDDLADPRWAQLEITTSQFT